MNEDGGHKLDTLFIQIDVDDNGVIENVIDESVIESYSVEHVSQAVYKKSPDWNTNASDDSEIHDEKDIDADVDAFLGQSINGTIGSLTDDNVGTHLSGLVASYFEKNPC